MEGEDGVFRQLEEESSMIDGLAGDIEDALAKFDELAGQLEVGYRLQVPGFRIQDSGFRVQDSWFWVLASGFRVEWQSLRNLRARPRQGLSTVRSNLLVWNQFQV